MQLCRFQRQGICLANVWIWIWQEIGDVLFWFKCIWYQMLLLSTCVHAIFQKYIVVAAFISEVWFVISELVKKNFPSLLQRLFSVCHMVFSNAMQLYKISYCVDVKMSLCKYKKLFFLSALSDLWNPLSTASAYLFSSD